MGFKIIEPGTPLDAPTSGGGGFHEVTPGTTLDQPGHPGGPQPHTTVPGVAASVGRGAMPYAVGAAAGGVIAGPPGAVVGAGLVGGAELAVGVYNQLADAMGWPKGVTPQEMTDKVLDWVGIHHPETGVERTAEAVGAGMGGTASTVKAAGQVAAKAAGPVVKGVAEELAKKPVAQTIGSGLSSAAAQTAAEHGAGPLGQWGAGIATAAAPGILGQTPRLVASRPKPSATAAARLGYRLPPGQVSDRPGLVSGVAAGAAGKLKLRDDAYTANQPVTTGLARADLGLTANDPPLHETVLESIRAREAQAYQNVGSSVQSIDPVKQISTPQPGGWNLITHQVDPEWQADLNNLGHIDAAARAEFPEIVGNKDIDDLRTTLLSKQSFTPEAALGTIKELRFQANANFQVRNDPGRLALAVAQKQAAQALEDMVERDITAKTNNPSILENWRRARERIAKTWDIQYALTPEGEVDARKLALLNATNRAGSRRRALGGNLQKIAETYANYPKALSKPTEVEPYTHWDWAMAVGGGLGALASGRYEALIAAAPAVVRPLVRKALLSRGYQGRITGTRPTPRYSPLNQGIFPYIAPAYIAPNRLDTLTVAPEQP